jgi:hypothetical protein
MLRLVGDIFYHKQKTAAFNREQFFVAYLAEKEYTYC